MKRLKSILGLLLAVIFIAASTIYFADHSDPQQWLDDFQVLKQGLSEAYANLEWAAEHNEIDLYALNRKTQDKLSETSSRRKAREIIKNFLKAFNDPHLAAVVAEPTQSKQHSAEALLTTSATTKDALEYMGFRNVSYDFKLNFDRIARVEELVYAGQATPSQPSS